MSNEGYDSDNNQGDKPKDGKFIHGVQKDLSF